MALQDHSYIPELDITDAALGAHTAGVFEALDAPCRYKGLRGGRGAAKSHFTAEQLLEDCATEHHRVACLREYQSSLAESSMQLLKDKIVSLGLEGMFSATQTEIRGPNDSLFVFKGLQGNNVYSLKSLEGYSRAWVEEAQSISQSSLEIMTPTFRKTPTMEDEPEMYFSWNPTEESDPCERMFLENTSPEIKFDDLGMVLTDQEILRAKLKTPTWLGEDFVCVTSNYYNNPWFPSDLIRDMERDRRRDPDRYAHVWLGEYQKLSQARVFRNWRVEAFETPADANFFLGADWGFGDPSVLVRCYLIGDTLYVDYEAYRSNCPIVDLPAMFDLVPLSRKWPIRADSARPETIHYMKSHGFPHMSESVKGPSSVEDGVEFLKSKNIVVHPRCRHTADELSRYSFKIDKKRNVVLPVLEDKHNHVIDALRYALEGERLGPKVFKVSSATKRWLRTPRRRGVYIPRSRYR